MPDQPRAVGEAERLRAAMIRAIRAAGGACTDDVSTDFLCHGAEEVEACISDLRRWRRKAEQERDDARLRAPQPAAVGVSEALALLREAYEALVEYGNDADPAIAAPYGHVTMMRRIHAALQAGAPPAVGGEATA